MISYCYTIWSRRLIGWCVKGAIFDMLFGHQGQLYVTKSQKGTYIVGLVCSDRILLAKGGLIVTNSNNYSFGNHFFKVLVQIHYSQYKQL